METEKQILNRLIDNLTEENKTMSFTIKILVEQNMKLTEMLEKERNLGLENGKKMGDLCNDLIKVTLPQPGSSGLECPVVDGVGSLIKKRMSVKNESEEQSVEWLKKITDNIPKNNSDGLPLTIKEAMNFIESNLCI